MGECFYKSISEMIPHEKHESFLWESSFGVKIQKYKYSLGLMHLISTVYRN